MNSESLQTWRNMYGFTQIKAGKLLTSLLLTLLFFLCITFGPAHAQVLTQTTKELGHGYRFQESKQINVSGRWHSNQSFKFLYFEKRYLCQCTEFSISPSGKYAIYQFNGSTTIASFNRHKAQVTSHNKLTKGKLMQVVWGKNEKQVELHILPEKPAGANADSITTTVKKRLTLK